MAKSYQGTLSVVNDGQRIEEKSKVIVMESLEAATAHLTRTLIALDPLMAFALGMGIVKLEVNEVSSGSPSLN